MNFLAADLAQTGERQAARGPGFEIPLALAPALRPAQSTRRSHRRRHSPRAAVAREARPATSALSGEVAMREVLGAEVVLHLESPAGPLTVRTDAGVGAAPRRHRAGLARSEARSIVFDGATEVRL